MERMIFGLRKSNSLLVLLAAQSSCTVGDVDVKLRSAFHDGLALLGRHVVCHLGAVLAVVHHQQFKISNVVHDNLVESIGQEVPSLLVGTITNVGHNNTASLELSADPRVNTLRPAPAFLQYRK